MHHVLKGSLRCPAVVICCYKPLWLLWFWFYDTQMKTVKMKINSISSLLLLSCLYVYYLAEVSSMAWNVLATAKYGTLKEKKKTVNRTFFKDSIMYNNWFRGLSKVNSLVQCLIERTEWILFQHRRCGDPTGTVSSWITLGCTSCNHNLWQFNYKLNISKQGCYEQP